MNIMHQQHTETLDKDWWRGAVIYQVYPRSYQDSNGDGVGDLKGITSRLKHIASLGVDAVWISPFFKSPMEDFGYDVSDYLDVDPMFGTLKDFDELIKTANALNLKVMIDLVLSHTSKQHDWFIESKSSKDNPKADWYVWSDAKPDGSPPNNWLSIFGGPAWQWSPKREQYYLHNFLASQPDLNFHCPDVQEALLDVAKFWLERGVAGFRLDTINFYMHDKDLRDNPPLPPEQRNATIAPSVNPYNHQQHLYDKNQPENLEFLRKLRAVMEPYGAAAVGEVGDDQLGLEILGQYTAGDDLMQMCYAFEFLANNRPTAKDIVDVMARFDEAAVDGWATWAFSNHDTPRHSTRWKLNLDGLKLVNTMMMCLRGSACIYQGEELGLPQADVAFENLQDPYGIEFWPEYKGRDGCRTPMVWNNSNQNGGFSTASPWLPVEHQHIGQSVDVQEQDDNSLLHHYRNSIALRHQYQVLAKGASTPLSADGDVLYFTRSDDEHTVFCAFNLSDEVAYVTAPKGSYKPIGNNLGSHFDVQNGKIKIEPWKPVLAIKS